MRSKLIFTIAAAATLTAALPLTGNAQTIIYRNGPRPLHPYRHYHPYRFYHPFAYRHPYRFARRHPFYHPYRRPFVR